MHTGVLKVYFYSVHFLYFVLQLWKEHFNKKKMGTNYYYDIPFGGGSGMCLSLCVVSESERT